MSNQDNNIEDLFRKAFEGRELPVTNSHWDAIAAGIAKRKRRIAFWWFAAAFLIVSGGSFGLYYSGLLSKTQTTINSKKEVKNSNSEKSSNESLKENSTAETKQNTGTQSTESEQINNSNSEGSIISANQKINKTRKSNNTKTSTSPKKSIGDPIIEKPIQIKPNTPINVNLVEEEMLKLISKNFSPIQVSAIVFEPSETKNVKCLACKKLSVHTIPGLELQFGLGAANNGASFHSSNENQLNTLRATDKNLVTINPYLYLNVTLKKLRFSVGLKHMTFGEKTKYDYLTRNVKVIPHLGQNGNIIGYFYLPGLGDTAIKHVRTKNIYQSIQLPLVLNFPIRFGHRGYLQLSGGTTLGYIYNIKASTPYRFHDVPGSNFLQDPSSSVNRFQVLGTLNLEYRMPISKSWMFTSGMQGNLQLNNFYKKSSDMTQMNRNLQLNFGLVYKIK